MSSAINPKILSQVRRQRGLRLTAVAAHTSIAESSLKQFERGKKQPSYKQVEKLADAYGVEAFYFFGDAPPNLASPPDDFRKREIESAQLSPKGFRAILFSERVGTFSKELSSGLDVPFLKLESKVREIANLQKKANELRSIFDEWYLKRESQFAFAGSNVTTTFSAIKLFIEAHGRVARSHDAPTGDYQGFYHAPDGSLPNIFVNRSIFSKKAQLFTLLHEYAHALLDQEGISDPFIRRNAIERKCNRFSAEFLAPADQFQKIVESQGRTLRSDTDALITFASRNSLLSKSAAAIRLKELGYISGPTLKDALALYRKSYKREKERENEELNIDFGWPHAKRMSEIGTLPIYLAKVAIDHAQIDSVDVKQSIELGFTVQEKAYDLAARRMEAALDQ